MTKRLKRIAPLQLGKMFAVIYGLFSLVLIPFLMLFGLIASLAPKTEVAHPMPMLIGMGMGMGMVMLIVPVIYPVMGFVGGVIGALIYNLAAKWLGGIEVEVE